MSLKCERCGNEDWVEVHINFAPFKKGKEDGNTPKYWVVGYNAGGIGTPLYCVDEDVKWFIKNNPQEFPISSAEPSFPVSKGLTDEEIAARDDL